MIQWKKSIREATWVLLITLVLACGAYALRPDRLPLYAVEETAASMGQEDALIKSISLEAAKAHFKSGSALFADARPYRAYQAGHIRGASHLDPNEFDEWSEQFLNRYPVDQVVITYCEGVQCQLSFNLAEKLSWLGYEKLYYLKDGWGQWKIHKLPAD